MATITIHQHHDAIRVATLTLPEGDRFFILHVGSDVAIILRGYDDVAMATARAIAEALTTAAEQLAARVVTEEPLLAEGRAR